MQNKQRLILAELNEINFEIVEKYINKFNYFRNFRKIFDQKILETESEKEYKNLEPWIQWVSIHTGLSFKDHKIFRLGDIIKSSHNQIFEKVEKKGFKVGVISAMNCKNNLKKSSYFIPDPWTKTSHDGSKLSKMITDLISQTVNENTSGRVTFKSLLTLIYIFFFILNLSYKLSVIKLIIGLRKRKWNKALILDVLIVGIHEYLFKKSKTEFSTVFLNAFAHIQHHYFFMGELVNVPLEVKKEINNKGIDPIFDAIKVYDYLIGRILKLNIPTIFATGMSQLPYDRLKYYYRLKDHGNFLKLLNIKFEEVIPRMTRDFLVRFKTDQDRDHCLAILQGILVDNKKSLFTTLDKRKKELFVTMGYPKKITSKTSFRYYKNSSYCNKELLPFVNLVDLKNGMHSSKGFLSLPKEISVKANKKFGNITNIYNLIDAYFDKKVVE